MTGGSWNELLRWIRPMHLLWNQVLDDMTAEQVNHHERSGVLPVAFSLYHYVYGEDRAVAERLLGEATLWNEDQAERTGIEIEPVRRGAPIEVAEQVRITDLDAWKSYQSEVFARTESTLESTPQSRWNEVVFEQMPDALRGGFINLLAGDGPVILGDLMTTFLYQHGMRHLGEIEHSRALVGLQGVG
jgi:hypothetical protein